MKKTATKKGGRPSLHKRSCQVKILLFADCWTRPLCAERLDRRHVRITGTDRIWFGAVLGRKDYEIVRDY